MKNILLCILLMLPLALFAQPTAGKGTLLIRLQHTVADEPLETGSREYQNAAGETYRIKTLKYYLSNLVLYSGGKAFIPSREYYLINVKDSASLQIRISLPAGSYDSLGFLPGVDSLRQVSGAQTGALDPRNDMYWTWQSGYILHKLEGSSPRSTAPHQRFEYHTGGYREPYSTLFPVTLRFDGGRPLLIRRGQVQELILRADLQHYWDAVYPIRIAEQPTVGLPGEMARKLAANFSRIFTLQNTPQP